MKLIGWIIKKLNAKANPLSNLEYRPGHAVSKEEPALEGLINSKELTSEENKEDLKKSQSKKVNDEISKIERESLKVNTRKKIETRSFNSPIDFVYERKEDKPDKINSGVIYIVGDLDYEWLIVFQCPCGCNAIVQLNLLKDASPCWKFRFRNNLISLSPSISREIGCHSHFFITEGKVNWRTSWDDY
jgi:hypothetical protein